MAEHCLEIKAGEGRLQLSARALWAGDDLVVVINGGEKPHVGAVAAAQPRPSLADPARTSASASVIAFSGHKEDLLARSAALGLASALGVKAVVTAGAHWDNLTPEEIARVEKLAREITARLIALCKEKEA